MLTAEQEARLTQGGDSFDHYHSSDRVDTHDDLRSLQHLAGSQTITSNFLASNEDFLLADTTAGNITVTLPRAKNGMEIEVTKIVAANSLIISPTGTDTTEGDTGITVTERWTSLRLKAISGGWILI